nr:hypothetical protein CFP56_03651 [Quercus suber]
MKAFRGDKRKYSKYKGVVASLVRFKNANSFVSRIYSFPSPDFIPNAAHRRLVITSLVQESHTFLHLLPRHHDLIDRVLLRRPSDCHPTQYHLVLRQPEPLPQHLRIPRHGNLQTAPQPALRQREHERLHEHAHAHRVHRRERRVHGDDRDDGRVEEGEVAQRRVAVRLAVRPRDVVARRAVQHVPELGAEVRELLGQRRDVGPVGQGLGLHRRDDAVARSAGRQAQAPVLDVGVGRRKLREREAGEQQLARHRVALVEADAMAVADAGLEGLGERGGGGGRVHCLLGDFGGCRLRVRILLLLDLGVGTVVGSRQCGYYLVVTVGFTRTPFVGELDAVWFSSSSAYG